MQMIEVDSIARSAKVGDGASKVRKSQHQRLNRWAIAAATLAAGLIVQTPSFAQPAIRADTGVGTAATTDAATSSDPEQAARESWRAVIRKIPVPGKGCFHVSYPKVAWESVECKATQPRMHHAPRTTTEAPATVGNGNDYIAQTQALTWEAVGKFFIGGVTSETNSGGISGSNEYSLQMNTNNDGSTNPCNGHPDCRVWQQFIYATDYNAKGEAGLFMQYWLLGWNDACPSGWITSPNFFGIDCFKNSYSASVPNIPVTQLGDVILWAYQNDGGDYLSLNYGDDFWSIGAEDNVLDISSVWYQTEFNVVGDMDSSEAYFNFGSQIIVVLQVLELARSESAPACIGQIATTGEKNNANLGTCQAGVGNKIDIGCGDKSNCVPADIYGPYIEFAETVPYPPVRMPPPVCIVCGIIKVAPQDEARADGTTSNGTASLK
jgi:hypothetical protein